jgi:hypothetical protein
VDIRRFEPALPRPHDRPARITVHFKHGGTLTSECLSARGGPDQPFEEEVILAKVEDIAAGVYPAFAAGIRKLAELEPKQMHARWRAVLDELTR